MSMEIVLSIVGGFLTVALAINAWILKEIHGDLSAVKVKLAEIFTTQTEKTKDINELEENQKEIFKRINKLEQSI